MLIPWTGLYQINQELNGFVLFTSYKTSLSDKSHVHSMYTLVMKLSNCWEQKVVSIYKWRILRLSRMDKESFTKDGSARISPAWIEWLKWWWIPQVVIEHLPVWSTVPLHPWIKILYHIKSVTTWIPFKSIIPYMIAPGQWFAGKNVIVNLPYSVVCRINSSISTCVIIE